MDLSGPSDLVEDHDCNVETEPAMGPAPRKTISLAEHYKWVDEERRRFAEETKDIPETEDELDDEAIEALLDMCESPRQRLDPDWTPAYQAKRDARKLPPSPPSTPRRLKGRKRSKERDHIPLLQLDKVQKSGRSSRVAPRRPWTRSYGMAGLSLHPHRKNHVIIWATSWRYVTISFEKYRQDWDPEAFDADAEPNDFHKEHPRYPHKTPHQREHCRRVEAREVALKKAVELPWSYKGIM